MKKIRFITVTAILVLNVCALQAQQIGMPLDTNRFFFPIHQSCVGRIISYEHLQLNHDFSVDVVCYFLDTTVVNNVVWQLPSGWTINNSNPNYFVGSFCV